MSNIQPIRGTHDLIGKKLILFNLINKAIHDIANCYDFKEIITPIFENTNLFKKPLGENSDVVLKEMYSFEDRNKSSLTLRPEYTTPFIRAAISNNLFERLPIKLFGLGPMFRRERPQKGRYRQFYQINFETLGTAESSADFELIILANEFLKKLKLNKKIKLYINSLGESKTIDKYKAILKDYYNKYKKDLSLESKLKIDTNPLRILDSKDKADLKINKEVPKINQIYSSNASKVFDEIQSLISSSGISFQVDHNLVRGLDYYCHTVFEFKADELGSQDTVIGGGRYDGLVKTLGGPDIPGVGWASGVERIMHLLDEIEDIPPLAQIIIINNEVKNYSLDLLIKLRKLDLKIRYDHKFNLKKSLKNANDSKIKFAIIIGENEFKNNNYTLKNLYEGSQKNVSLEELIKIIKK